MRILISNLNSHTTTSHLASLFLPFGMVSSARILTNRKSGSSKGEAIIEMEYKAALIAITTLNNFRFMNFFIKVEQSFA